MHSPQTPTLAGGCRDQRQQMQQQQEVAAAASPPAGALVERPINTLAQQLHGMSISKPKKREQAAATPASQARPRTQRRTGAAWERQEDGGGGAADEASFTPSRLSCLGQLADELSCGICLELCTRPCSTPCGHVFCRSCLRQAMQHKRQCPKCREVLPSASHFQPRVNTVLWNTIGLLFPNHAAQAPLATPSAPAPAAGPARPGRRAGHRQMAEALSGAGGALPAGFRRPRPAGSRGQPEGATQQQGRPGQQGFAMDPPLASQLDEMLQGLQGTVGAGAPSRRSRSGRRTGGNPFVVGRAAPPDEVIRLDSESEEDEGWEELLDELLEGSPLIGGRGISMQRQRPAARPLAARRRAREAAAGRVHAAIASALAGAEDGGDDALLQQGIAVSLRDSRPGQHRQQRQQRGQQRPGQQRGTASAASLFEHVHSGSSPQQHWAESADGLQEVLQDSDSGSEAPAAAAPAAASRGRRRGHARVLDDEDGGQPVVQQAASPPAGADVLDLTLAASPDPQPLLARLAHLGPPLASRSTGGSNVSGAQQDRHQQQRHPVRGNTQPGGSSGGGGSVERDQELSQLVAAALGSGEGAPGRHEMLPAAAGRWQVEGPRSGGGGGGGGSSSSDDSDDFQPPTRYGQRRLTAARVVAAAPTGRVVSGLRRRGGRRPPGQPAAGC